MESWPHLATTPGSEFFYIASLAPTTSLLLQFYLQMRRELELKRKEAHAARLTQMLAHDVRKPFTILKTVLQNLRSNDTSTTYEMLVSRHLPPIERAIATTDGLIRDVMELGVKQSPICELADLSDLLIQAVEQCIHGDLKTTVNIVYNLNHEKKLFVDGRKIDRVFVNILDNAISAMRANGTIELQSRDIALTNSGLSEIEVSIANDGPAINWYDLRYIFDDFYSGEKRVGLVSVSRSPRKLSKPMAVLSGVNRNRG